MTNSKTHTFHVHGMHCKSCVLITESELNDHPSVASAKSDLTTRTVEITGDFGDVDPEIIANELSQVLKKHGYHLSLNEEIHNRKLSDFKIALPIAVGFLFLFFLMQKVGLVNLISGGSVSYGTAFVVGIIASLSTCMAVVGGLVLSMSATFAKSGERVRPQMLFHIGRIVSFFILGGVIGALGSAFALNTLGVFILGMLIAVVMLVMGLNLLDTFEWTKKLQPSMPKFISRRVLGLSRLNHTLTPLLVGVSTFFLPCGFTQSMQVYTLSTGSFIAGGLTMLAFALGTLPVLMLLSFGAYSIEKSSKSGIFFKSAGLIVIMFAVYNLYNSLVVIGALPPLLNI